MADVVMQSALYLARVRKVLKIENKVRPHDKSKLAQKHVFDRYAELERHHR